MEVPFLLPTLLEFKKRSYKQQNILIYKIEYFIRAYARAERDVFIPYLTPLRVVFPKLHCSLPLFKVCIEFMHNFSILGSAIWAVH